VTVTLPAQATVAWNVGETLSLLNLGVGTVTITPAAGVTINGTPLTLATSKGGSLVRTASNTWTFIPFSAGEGAANFTNTATGTFSSGGIDYKFLTATGSLSLIVDRAGFADVLCVGAGGGGGKSKDANTAGMGGGGAGGVLNTTQAYFGVGSHTIVVGAGGITGSNGNTSRIGDYYGVGGGNGADIELAAAQATPASPGGSGGGGCYLPTAGGLGTSGQGNNGGTGTTLGGGGGGGATAVGANASGNNGGNGGAGVSNSINNVATNYGGGGGGGRYASGTAGTGGIGGGGAGGSSSIGVAGTALTGGGGGGGTFTSPTGYTGGSGGSGIVIVRVVV